MKVTGKTICNTAMAKNSGQTTQSMKESIMKAKSMVEVFMSGLMALCLMVIGLRIESKAMELTLGSMGVNIQVLGRITTCMVMEFTPGRMADDMKAIMKWTRSMAMEFINGLMGDAMMVTGLMESSMVKESTFYQMELLK